MPDITDTQRDLQALDAELRKLEAEYNMYFAGRAPRPPWETRGRVETLFKRWSRTHVQSGVDRFRLDALQMRYRKFIELWDRAMRAREEGRPGPFAQRQATPPAIDEREQAPATKVLSVTSFTDPLREMDKLHALYDSLMEARRGVGESIVPFHKFAALVQERVGKLRQPADGAEVAFRVAVKDGKVSLTAKGLKRD
ncbi:MAG TPA: MXAN_5187 C-terminal domain-containing protein [Vicinamibacterales bacterium]|nr:MXAN_5187 C-terminal domain-containing protein [Vicinamibacterales bacterium]